MNQLFLAITNGFNFYTLGVTYIHNIYKECSFFLAKKTTSHLELTTRGRPCETAGLHISGNTLLSFLSKFRSCDR